MVTPSEKISALVRSGKLSVESFSNSGARYLESPSLMSSLGLTSAILERPRSAILYLEVLEKSMFSRLIGFSKNGNYSLGLTWFDIQVNDILLV